MRKFLLPATVVALILFGIAGAALFVWGFMLVAGGEAAPPWLLVAAVVAAIGVLAGVGITIWRHTQRQ
jgi:hypothetical protein